MLDKSQNSISQVQEHISSAYKLLLDAYGWKIEMCKFSFAPFAWLCRNTIGEDASIADLRDLAAQFSGHPGKVAALNAVLSNQNLPTPPAKKATQTALKYELSAYDAEGNRHPALTAITSYDVPIEYANFIRNEEDLQCIGSYQSFYMDRCLETCEGV